MLVDLNTSRTHIGVGLYTLADVARYSGAKPAVVRRWLSESSGIVPRYFPRNERLLTFEELMEAHFIQMFRAEGVSFQTIRRASEAAAKRFNTKYPFSVRRFDTDGKAVFATLLKASKSKPLVEDLERGQYVFRSIMRPFFRKLDYRGGDGRIARFWPRTKQGRVVLDPNRCFGKPIDAETGVSTRAIYDAVIAGGGQSPAVVARWLGIPPAAVNAAVAFEQHAA